MTKPLKNVKTSTIQVVPIKSQEFLSFKKKLDEVFNEKQFTITQVLTIAFWKIYNLEKTLATRATVDGRASCSHAKNQLVHKPNRAGAKINTQKPKASASKSKSNLKPNGQKARKALPKSKSSAGKPSKSAGKNIKRK